MFNCVFIVSLLYIPTVLSTVDFDHFHILRAIGKGAFGKVGG